jgi:16S rRNA (guanine527-N7)-methyltransferase
VLSRLLAEGSAALGVALPADARDRLLAYLGLLQKWNRAYNLTAVREPAAMVTRHLLDSLAIAPYVRGPRVLDIGTGPGLPGVPLAVALPGLDFVLLDSNGKKVRFLRQAVAELGLGNVQVEHARVEQFRPREKFDTLVSRAFASIGAMLAAAAHLCQDTGRFLAMKGVYPEAELADIPPAFRVEAVERLMVPGLDEQRHVVIISPRGEQGD